MTSASLTGIPTGKIEVESADDIFHLYFFSVGEAEGNSNWKTRWLRLMTSKYSQLGVVFYFSQQQELFPIRKQIRIFESIICRNANDELSWTMS